MKYLKEYSQFNDEWYYEITKIDMEKIPDKDFIDIDSRVLPMIKDHLTEWILENCPRISVSLTRDNWIGLKKEGIVIDGFDFYQSGVEKAKWHPNQTVRWMRIIKISQLSDEWFLTSITATDYSIYFKCDQIDGLMRFLEDYSICEWNMVKESVDEVKEQISDYFIEFEDKGGTVVVKYEPEVNVYLVTIFTNEPYIQKKINWQRLSADFNILGFKSRQLPVFSAKAAYRLKGFMKRTCDIVLCKKGQNYTDWLPGFGPIGPQFNPMKPIVESLESESLVKKISENEWYEFESTHKHLKPDDTDIRMYKEFMLQNFTLEEVDNFQNIDYDFGFRFRCDFVEINDEGEEYNSGRITINKFDDEWWVVEKMTSAFHRQWDYWLVDTKEGFKDIDLWA